MKSFRTRLALLSALISAVVIVVLAVAGTLLTRRLLMQSLDMQLAVPLDRISRDLHPRTDLERVRSNAEIVHGNDIAEGKLLMMMRHDREGEILYRAPEDDWLDALAPELWKRDAPFDAPARRPPFEPHEPGEFAGEPRMFPPPHPPPFDRPLPG